MTGLGSLIGTGGAEGLLPTAGVEGIVGRQKPPVAPHQHRETMPIFHTIGLLGPARLTVEKQGQARQCSSQVHPGRVYGVSRPSNRRRKQVTDHRVRRRGLLQKRLKRVFSSLDGERESQEKNVIFTSARTNSVQ